MTHREGQGTTLTKLTTKNDITMTNFTGTSAGMQITISAESSNYPASIVMHYGSYTRVFDSLVLC